MLTKDQCREIARKAEIEWGATKTGLRWHEFVADSLHAAFVEEAERLPKEVHFVCDGPPGPEAGRFVELEDETGRSISLGDWKPLANGLWELVISLDRAPSQEARRG